MTSTANVARTERPNNGQNQPARSTQKFTPRVDIFENETELLVYADLPGVRSEDVDLHYEQGELTVHGKVRGHADRPAYLAQEYAEGDFFRSFTIHESIDASRIDAECKNGVLTVHLPKVEAARPRQISVKGQ